MTPASPAAASSRDLVQNFMACSGVCSELIKQHRDILKRGRIVWGEVKENKGALRPAMGPRAIAVDRREPTDGIDNGNDIDDGTNTNTNTNTPTPAPALTLIPIPTPTTHFLRQHQHQQQKHQDQHKQYKPEQQQLTRKKKL